MSQSRKGSLVESLVNVAVGYVVAVAAQAVIFPMFGHSVTLTENMLMGLFFTVISIVRSYALRRVFNAWTVRRVPEPLSPADAYQRRIVAAYGEVEDDGLITVHSPFTGPRQERLWEPKRLAQTTQFEAGALIHTSDPRSVRHHPDGTISYSPA